MNHPVNTRLNILQAQYDAMKVRADANPRVLARYEALIADEYRKSGKAANEQLQVIR